MSQFLPEDVESSLLALLTPQLSGVDCDSIGAKDIDDNDQLVLQMPCARTRYIGLDYGRSDDNQQLTYPNAAHQIEIWCADENLSSKELQREASKQLAGLVVGIVAGARLVLGDGSKSEPIRMLGISTMPDDIVGTVYIVVVAIPGIAQLPGVNG